MAPHTSASLRVITQRLSSTPIWQLPHIVPYLASTISEHGKLFISTENQNQSSDGVDNGVLLHKYKTQISTLLQEKNPQARWAAIVLIKATVEIGGWEILQSSGPWVRGLLAVLGKRDPPVTQKVCIITLTRIFLLTHDHQSLVREITTPSLPGFITSCINSCKSGTQSPLMQIVLDAFIQLIPHHPTSFRPFVGRIRSLIVPLLASTPSSITRTGDKKQDEQPTATPELLAQSARYLFVLLSVCAPKNTAGEEWAKSLNLVIDATQTTADLSFRAVYEDWESSSTRPRTANDPDSYAAMVSHQQLAPLDLPRWRGIHAGLERLDGLLQTLQAFLANPTSMAVALPVGSLLDVVNRMLSILPPSNGVSLRINPEISREEREGLWIGLPRIHVSTIALLSLLLSRLEYASAPASHIVLEEVLWVLQHEHANSDVRTTTYELVSQILTLFGPSLPNTLSKPLSICVKLCCKDLLPSSEQPVIKEVTPGATSKKPARNGSSTINADSYIKAQSNHPSTSCPPTDVQIAAAGLLPLLLTKLPSNFLSFSLRTQIDRTAILTQNEQAMLAGVLNPPLRRKGSKQISSIMPVLARSFPGSMEVEALIRPRMLVLQRRRGEEAECESESESENDDDVIMEVPDTYTVHEGENNVPQPIPTSIQDTSMAEPRANIHIPPQRPSQASQPTSPEIPETQSFPTNPKKRDLDTASNSQTSTKPSDTTVSQIALPQSADSEAATDNAARTSTFPITKRPRLDHPSIVPDTQAAPPASATAELPDPIPSISNPRNQASQPAELAAPLPPAAAAAKRGSADVDSSDDENFEIPAIDPTMDTDEEEDDDEENEDEA